MGNPFLRAGEAPARDVMALEKLGDALDRLHMTRSSLETADYQDRLLSRMIDYLQVDGERKAALRTALLRVAADCLEAAKPVERLRRQLIDAGEEGPLVDSYRAAWQASLENRARAFRALDAVLDATPRHRLFREHAARWIFFLESHAQQR